MMELLTPAQMAVVDAAAPEFAVPIATLMDNAGRAVAHAVRRHYAPCRVLVLCGPGNNGGDGVVAARLLQREGWPVAVAGPAGLVRPWPGVRVAFTAAETARAELVIDALYGAGLGRDLDVATADVLRAAPRVMAVDVPSGVDGASGQVRGYARQAERTVTFFRRKPGHLLLPGRGLCGETMLADIGMPIGVLDRVRAATFHNRPGLWHLPVLAEAGHKYDRGHVTILGGSVMTGAARLAADAARRGGAGLVTIATSSDAAAIYRLSEPGTIVSSAALEELLTDTRRKVWVCGPGVGADAAAVALPVLLASDRQVVVDADALTLCAGAPDRLRGAAVLTPHEGEFAKVFGPVGPDRLDAARRAAAATGAVVVLKGSDTVIADPDARAAINDSAPPWLATAGAGDVLSGIIAALLSQGMPRWEAACAGVWLHGRAAHHVGAHLVAEDLAPALPRAFADAGPRGVV